MTTLKTHINSDYQTKKLIVFSRLFLMYRIFLVYEYLVHGQNEIGLPDQI